jgi:glycosyltransferase involved in cell wall biosynthesis
MLSHSVHNKKIIFLTPYPFDTAPGQRFRYEQYLNILKEQGYKIQISSFLSESAYRLLYKPGKTIQKFLGVVAGIIRRFATLPIIATADFVFVFREVCPVGPPLFEWIIAKILRKKIIYDFDDAIWMTDVLCESFFTRMIRWRRKVSCISRWSYKVSCGNDYLCNYARQFNQHVVLNPTTIETELLHNPSIYKKELSTHVTIGWTGSHSTLKYLAEIEEVLRDIEQNIPAIKILIIANQKPQLALRTAEFIPWQKQTEAVDLLKIDIGIMPLPDDEWTKGKCGFKALQYMAMGIPAVVSPIGVNSIIIDHGKNGFLAKTKENWLNYLSQLISDVELRKTMGKYGREKVIRHYSVRSNSSNFLSLFT